MTTIPDNNLKLLKALAQARREFRSLRKDSRGQRNTYASFTAIKECIDKVLDDNGIYWQYLKFAENGQDFVVLELIHLESGERQKTFQTLLNDPNSPISDANQRMGASTTYAMRDLARSLFCLDADDDDLDNYAHEKGSNGKTYNNTRTSSGTSTVRSRTNLSDEQVKELQEKIPNEQLLTRILEFNKVSKLSELTVDQYDKIIKLLDR